MFALSHQCPKCNFTFEVNHKTSFDTSDMEDLIQGVYCIVTCSRCNQKLNTRPPMFYHDEKHKLYCHMGWNGFNFGVSAPKDIQQFLESRYDLKNYSLRECMDYNEFLEKIRIFAAGFDDIAMEYVKYVTRKEAGDGSDNNELWFLKEEHNTLHFHRWNEEGERLKNWTQHPSLYDLAKKTIQQMKDDGTFIAPTGFVRVNEYMWRVFRNKYFEAKKTLKMEACTNSNMF